MTTRQQIINKNIEKISDDQCRIEMLNVVKHIETGVMLTDEIAKLLRSYESPPAKIVSTIIMTRCIATIPAMNAPDKVLGLAKVGNVVTWCVKLFHEFEERFRKNMGACDYSDLMLRVNTWLKADEELTLRVNSYAADTSAS